MRAHKLSTTRLLTTSIKVTSIPTLKFNCFQAPEYDIRSTHIEDVRPGQVIAVEDRRAITGSSEIGLAVPAVALGMDKHTEALRTLNYQGELDHVDQDDDAPRIFDLGATVLLTPLSRERANAIYKIVNHESTDPLCIALQSIALHYAASDEDLSKLY